jgi:class 3 adenylate cyclase
VRDRDDRLRPGDGPGGLDLPIRIGINTGEVEFVGDDIRGMTVHAAARLLDLAGLDEIMVSASTRDLIESSGVVLEDAGAHELKGLTGARQVFRVVMPVA